MDALSFYPPKAEPAWKRITMVRLGAYYWMNEPDFGPVYEVIFRREAQQMFWQIIRSRLRPVLGQRTSVTHTFRKVTGRYIANLFDFDLEGKTWAVGIRTEASAHGNDVTDIEMDSFVEAWSKLFYAVLQFAMPANDCRTIDYTNGDAANAIVLYTLPLQKHPEITDDFLAKEAAAGRIGRRSVLRFGIIEATNSEPQTARDGAKAKHETYNADRINDAFQVWLIRWERPGKYRVESHSDGPLRDALAFPVMGVYRTEDEALFAVDELQRRNWSVEESLDLLRPPHVLDSPIAYLVTFIVLIRETGEATYLAEPTFGGELRWRDERDVVAIFKTLRDAKAYAHDMKVQIGRRAASTVKVERDVPLRASAAPARGVSAARHFVSSGRDSRTAEDVRESK